MGKSYIFNQFVCLTLKQVVTSGLKPFGILELIVVKKVTSPSIFCKKAFQKRFLSRFSF